MYSVYETKVTEHLSVANISAQSLSSSIPLDEQRFYGCLSLILTTAVAFYDGINATIGRAEAAECLIAHFRLGRSSRGVFCDTL